MGTFNAKATVTVKNGEGYVRISDLAHIVYLAAPQGQYERFQERYIYDFLKAAKKAADEMQEEI